MRFLLFIRSIVWTAVLAVLLAGASIILDSAPIGLASIALAVLSLNTKK